MIIEHNPAADAPMAPVWTRAATANRGAVAWWNAERRERGLNWLAFGLLLAAWNFSDNDAVKSHARRPAEFVNHGLITVRSARDHVN